MSGHRFQVSSVHYHFIGNINLIWPTEMSGNWWTLFVPGFLLPFGLLETDWGYLILLPMVDWWLSNDHEGDSNLDWCLHDGRNISRMGQVNMVYDKNGSCRWYCQWMVINGNGQAMVVALGNQYLIIIGRFWLVWNRGNTPGNNIFYENYRTSHVIRLWTSFSAFFKMKIHA